MESVIWRCTTRIASVFIILWMSRGHKTSLSDKWQIGVFFPGYYKDPCPAHALGFVITLYSGPSSYSGVRRVSNGRAL